LLQRVARERSQQRLRKVNHHTGGVPPVGEGDFTKDTRPCMASHRRPPPPERGSVIGKATKARRARRGHTGTHLARGKKVGGTRTGARRLIGPPTRSGKCAIRSTKKAAPAGGSKRGRQPRSVGRQDSYTGRHRRESLQEGSEKSQGRPSALN